MDGSLVNSAIPLVSQTVVSPVTQTSSNLSRRPRDKWKTPAFLSNLGKATLRGIRKCPQCGVYNGTRGLSCKNKACGTIFRDGDHGTGRLKKGACEVVQVVTDSGGGRAGGPQVFSVHQRGRGSEQQGGHQQQAMECQTQATPLPLKSSVLEALVATSQAKEELWRLATETPGPLVQRVSKGTLIVKCQPGEVHPLGLLHLTVGLSGVKDKTVGAHNLPEHCLHFYACVCAFTSDEKLASEFSLLTTSSVICFPLLFFGSVDLSLFHTASFVSSTSLLAVKDTSAPTLNQRKPTHRKHFNSTGLKNPGSSQPVDETHVSLGFQQWLASVTERIHQTMHFQFDGKPEPLVFHIPQAFFNALQQRLSLGSKKRRLPNYTTTFVRNDALPLGSFTKYTWHITNLMHVKRIFDTPELPLELTQSFVKNSDSSYSPYRCRETPTDPASDTCHHSRTNKPLAIGPLELRTFLRVGTCAAEQTEPVPLVIEWIPDILPHSQVGELRIRFEYGHQLGSKPEHCKSSAGTERTEQTDAIPHH
uniref:Chromosome 2 open reading frame 42 n=1 Tax=Sinocyclocheilus anshuiensis TaxID=1608454 RepID=A0A671S6U9_9TELE